MSLIFPAMTIPRLCQHLVRCHSGRSSVVPMTYIGLASHCSWWKSSTGRRAIFTHNTKSHVKLKEKELDVSPGFGVLHVTGTIDFLIKPTNVQVREKKKTCILTVFTIKLLRTMQS